MIDGNPYEFIETAYTGQDIVFLFNGKKYWFQGYTKEDGIAHMEITQYSPEVEEDLIWEVECNTMEECMKALQEDKIFNEKTFWEVEQEIQWVDN
jgi:hypothetical protein